MKFTFDTSTIKVILVKITFFIMKIILMKFTFDTSTIKVILVKITFIIKGHFHYFIINFIFYNVHFQLIINFTKITLNL